MSRGPGGDIVSALRRTFTTTSGRVFALSAFGYTDAILQILGGMTADRLGACPRNCGMRGPRAAS